MTNKVVLTKEQAEAIEKYKLMSWDVSNFIAVKDQWTSKYAPLKTLTVDEMAIALYVGYEIEQPKIEVGDWVVRTKYGFHGVKRVSSIDHRYLKVEEDDVSYLLENTRHATKEEIFWAELGRESGELRIGDVYCYENGISYSIDNQDRLEMVKNRYKKGSLKGFYPAESFKPFPKDGESE